MVCNLNFHPPIHYLNSSNFNTEQHQTVNAAAEEQLTTSNANTETGGDRLLDLSVRELIMDQQQQSQDQLPDLYRQQNELDRSSLADQQRQYPFHRSPIELTSMGRGGGIQGGPLNGGDAAGQQQQQQQQVLFEISAVKICCLLTKTGLAFDLGLDGSLESSDHGEGSSGSSDEAVLPSGEYYRAVKVASIGSTVSLIRGRKYLIVTPYQSCLSEYYSNLASRHPTRQHPGRSDHSRRLTAGVSGSRRKRSSSCISSHSRDADEDLDRGSTSASSSTAFQRKRAKNGPLGGRSESVAYPFEDFEKSMLGECRTSGRCGLYELTKLHSPSRRELQYVKSRTDQMLIFLPDSPALEAENKDGKKGKKNGGDGRQCACEFVKVRAVVMIEMMARVMTRLVGKLKEVDGIPNSSTAWDFNWKGKEKMSWNFADLLKTAESSGPWVKLSELFSNSEAGSAGSSRGVLVKEEMNSLKYSKQYLISELLNVRLSLISKCRLARPIIDEGVALDAYGRVTFPDLAVADLLASLSQPVVSHSLLMSAGAEPYLIGRLPDRRIVDGIESQMQLIQSEISKLNSRVRVLIAVLELLKSLRMNSANSSSSQAESGANADVNQESAQARTATPNLSASAFSLHDSSNLRRSMPAVLNDLEFERANLRLLNLMSSSWRLCSRALNSVSHIEDWSDINGNNTEVWAQLIGWCIKNGEYFKNI